MNRPPADSGPHYQALLELLRAAESLWNASRVFFARWDLSPSQFNVLNLLHDLPEGCSQMQLSRQLITHRSNITGLVDRLEARGLVRRENHPSDRRAFNVRTTPAGRALVEEILPHYYRSAEAVWNGVSAERARRIVREMSALGAAAQKIAGGLAENE